MFDYHETERFFWFKSDSFESPMKFELIGIMLGLAIFNSVILDVHLPMATYKKLMDVSPTLEDLV
jgi:ubiquitin-protein ligase E3 A